MNLPISNEATIFRYHNLKVPQNMSTTSILAPANRNESNNILVDSCLQVHNTGALTSPLHRQANYCAATTFGSTVNVSCHLQENNKKSNTSRMELQQQSQQLHQQQLSPPTSGSLSTTSTDTSQRVVQHNYHDHFNDPIYTQQIGDAANEAEMTTNPHDLSSSQQSCPQSNGKRTRKGARGGVVVPFPVKLHYMLSRADEDGVADVVSWQPHGRCFVIRQPKRFSEEVMPKYFNQSKFTSFIRQVNLYGFCRLTKGLDRGGYYNELFLRGRPDLCKRILRQRIKGTKTKAAPSPDTEPCFYSMQPATKLTSLKESIQSLSFIHFNNNGSSDEKKNNDCVNIDSRQEEDAGTSKQTSEEDRDSSSSTRCDKDEGALSPSVVLPPSSTSKLDINPETAGDSTNNQTASMPLVNLAEVMAKTTSHSSNSSIIDCGISSSPSDFIIDSMEVSEELASKIEDFVVSVDHADSNGRNDDRGILMDDPNSIFEELFRMDRL